MISSKTHRQQYILINRRLILLEINKSKPISRSSKSKHTAFIRLYRHKRINIIKLNYRRRFNFNSFYRLRLFRRSRRIGSRLLRVHKNRLRRFKIILPNKKSLSISVWTSITIFIKSTRKTHKTKLSINRISSKRYHS